MFPSFPSSSGAPVLPNGAVGGAPLLPNIFFGGVPQLPQPTNGGAPVLPNPFLGGAPLLPNGAVGGAPVLQNHFLGGGGAPLLQRPTVGGAQLFPNMGFGGAPVVPNHFLGAVPQLPHPTNGGAPVLPNSFLGGGGAPVHQNPFLGAPVVPNSFLGGGAAPVLPNQFAGGAPVLPNAGFGGAPFMGQPNLPAILPANQGAPLQLPVLLPGQGAPIVGGQAPLNPFLPFLANFGSWGQAPANGGALAGMVAPNAGVGFPTHPNAWRAPRQQTPNPPPPAPLPAPLPAPQLQPMLLPNMQEVELGPLLLQLAGLRLQGAGAGYQQADVAGRIRRQPSHLQGAHRPGAQLQGSANDHNSYRACVVCTHLTPRTFQGVPACGACYHFHLRIAKEEGVRHCKRPGRCNFDEKVLEDYLNRTCCIACRFEKWRRFFR